MKDVQNEQYPVNTQHAGRTGAQLHQRRQAEALLTCHSMAPEVTAGGCAGPCKLNVWQDVWIKPVKACKVGVLPFQVHLWHPWHVRHSCSQSSHSASTLSRQKQGTLNMRDRDVARHAFHPDALHTGRLYDHCSLAKGRHSPV